MSKFKPYETIYVMDLEVNGSRINPNGLFIRELFTETGKGTSLIQICGVKLNIKNERILSVAEFKEEMKKRNEKEKK